MEADMVVAVECNKDTHYFGSIVESLTRDLHCYFVQVNTSEYGDSRISQPTKREKQNILTVKGGINQTVLIGEVDFQSLRKFQIMNNGGIDLVPVRCFRRHRPSNIRLQYPLVLQVYLQANAQ
jgi:hypothetical protein